MEFKAKLFLELTTDELYEILKARAAVFVMEQNIHYLDTDDIDRSSLHCFITDGHRVVAYLRAYFPNGEKAFAKVGRVLTVTRGRGDGKRLMTESEAAIKERLGCSRICMDAQKHAVGFYEKLGFRVTSEEFLEEGIVHVKMEKEI